MRRSLLTLAVLTTTLSISTGCVAQSAATSLPAPSNAIPSSGQLTFTFDRPGMDVPHYSVQVAEDQRGIYIGEVTSSPGSSALVPITAELQLTIRTTRTLFTTARSLFAPGHSANRPPQACGMTQKNLADTGSKTLRYVGPEGEGACTYNQSDSKEVVALTNIFQGISEMLAAGRRLDFDHRFDRLALDTEMTTLVDEVVQGRATEPGVIARTLRSIVRDPEVIERVRLKAEGLLQSASAAD